MISNAILYGREQSLAVLAAPLPHRGDPERPITAGALMEVGRCPWRWVHTPDPDEPLIAHGPMLCELLALDEAQANKMAVRRPDTYEAMKLECPKCGSPGPAQSCTKCGTRRRNIVKPRPWTNAAKYCAAWVQKAEEQGRKIVPPAEWDRAAGQAASVAKDLAVSSLIRTSLALRTIDAVWTDEASGLAIPIRTRASLVPADEFSPLPAVAMFTETRNADPKVWEGLACWNGLHIRAALTLDMWNCLNKVDCREFFWIVVERDAPYVVGRRRAAPELLAEGRARYTELLASYVACLGRQQWPRFEDESANGAASWTKVWMQDWMAAGTGPHGGFFAPTVIPRQLEPDSAHATTA